MSKEENHIPHPYELFGIECGKGWHKLLEPIIGYIETYNKDKDEEHQIKLTQVKEKWGLLRIYVNFGTHELYELIDEAEDKSQNVCELCGTEKNVGTKTSGWMLTLCLDCMKKETQKIGIQQFWQRNSDKKHFIIKTDETIEEL